MQRPFDSSPQTPEGQPLWQSLHRCWQALSGFMVHRAAAAPTLHPAQRRYGDKGRFYGYLPPSEEQRDWLEKIYHQSQDG